MFLCTAPVTTVSNQVSFSLLWFPGVNIAFQGHTGLGFGFPHAFSETFYLITSFVKFQADVAIVNRSLAACRVQSFSRVLVDTRSHCLEAVILKLDDSFFTLTAPSTGELVRASGRSLSSRTLTQGRPLPLLCNPTERTLGGTVARSSFPKHGNEDVNCLWQCELCPSGVPGGSRPLMETRTGYLQLLVLILTAH